MRGRRALPTLLALLAVGALLPSLAHATSSEQFYSRGGHLYDGWGIFRTRSSGADGFLAITSTGFDPIIARESLGENTGLAWQMGEELARKYPDRNQRAEQIFYFVRDRVTYTSDTDQFDRREFAQNADEVAATIGANGGALGDCEDSAIFLAVLYKAAGYRSAMVLMPGHVATLVYLPEYRKAARKLTLAGDPGWVWAEATGDTNPFGWVPEALISGKDMIAREVIAGPLEAQEGSPDAITLEKGEVRRGSGTTSGGGLIRLMMIMGFLWMLPGLTGATRRLGRRR